MPQSFGQDDPEMSEALRAFARLLGRQAAREALSRPARSQLLDGGASEALPTPLKRPRGAQDE